MSDNSSEQEPSIEEILASIRQIISDDDEEGTPEEAAPAEAKAEEAPAPEPEPVEEPEAPEEDVLELTSDDLIDDSDEEDDLDPMETPDIDMRDTDEPEEDPNDFDFDALPGPEAAAPPPPSEILSSTTQSAAIGSISKLTSQMPVNRSRSFDGVTIEDLVRDMLHPMLREWMDDNLPPMVERIVQKELEKLARRAMDQ